MSCFGRAFFMTNVFRSVSIDGTYVIILLLRDTDKWKFLHDGRGWQNPHGRQVKQIAD